MRKVKVTYEEESWGVAFFMYMAMNIVTLIGACVVMFAANLFFELSTMQNLTGLMISNMVIYAILNAGINPNKEMVTREVNVKDISK